MIGHRMTVWRASYISSITGSEARALGSMTIYSVQWLPLLRALIMFGLGAVLVARWKSFSNDDEIARVL